MGLYSDFFGGSQETKSSSKTTYNVPAWLENRSKKIIKKADQILDKPFERYSTDDRIAPLNDDIRNAFQLGRDAVGTWKPYLDEASSLTRTAANSQWNTDTANKWMDPYTELVIKRAQEDMNRNYQQQQMLNNAKRTATSGFLRPNAQADVGDQRTFSNYIKESGDLTNKMMSENYQSALQAWLNSRTSDLASAQQLGQMGNEAARLNAADYQQLMGVGQAQRNYEQLRRDFDWSEFNRERTEPQNTMSWMTSLLGSVPYTREVDGQSKSVTSNNPSYMDAIGQVTNFGAGAALGLMGGGAPVGGNPMGGVSTNSGSGILNPYGGSSNLNNQYEMNFANSWMAGGF